MNEEMSRAKGSRRIDPPSDEKIRLMAKCDTSSALTKDFPEITMSDVGKLARAYLRHIPPYRLSDEPKVEPKAKEAACGGVDQEVSIPVENIHFVSEEYRQRLANNDIQLKGFEPKEAAPEAAGAALRMTSEEFQCLSQEHKQAVADAEIRVVSPELATEGAPETTLTGEQIDSTYNHDPACGCDICNQIRIVELASKKTVYWCHYHNGPFKEECPLGGKCERKEDWGKVKADGEDKSAERPKLRGHLDKRGTAAMFIQADRHMDALESRNAELVEKIADYDKSCTASILAWENKCEKAEREVERLTLELSSTSAALERDRTSLCAPLKAIREAIKCREWLRLGRGSFEWDDDRWRDEFGFAIDEILAAIDPLAKIAADWSNCPKHTAEVEAARIDWQARALKAERELDDLKTANVDAKFREGYCESPAQAMVNSMPNPRVNDNFIQSRIYWGRAEGTGDVGIYEELQAWRAWAAGRVGK